MSLRLAPRGFKTAGAAPRKEVPILTYRAPQIAYEPERGNKCTGVTSSQSLDILGFSCTYNWDK